MTALNRFFRTDILNIYQYVSYGFIIALFWGAVLFSSRIELFTENRIIFDFIIGTVGIVLTSVLLHNIWQLKKTHEEKKREEEVSRWRLAAVENAGDGVCLINSVGNLIYMNRALRDMYGIAKHTMDDYIDHEWQSLFTQVLGEEVKSVFAVIEESGKWRGELPVVTVSGDRDKVAEISLIKLPDGGMIGTARDVTERKAAEEEKAELQWQFFQSQKMEAVGRLAGGIAHDFNNNLASMMGYARFLFEDLPEKSEEKEFAQNILKAGDQSQKLIERLLAFSRPERVSRHEQMDLSVALKDALAMAESSIPGGISLKKTLENEKFPVKLSQSYLSQLFMNFFMNAKDAMSDGHGVLSVSLESLSEKKRKQFPAAFLNHERPERPGPLKISVGVEDEKKTAIYLGGIIEGQEYALVTISDTGCGMTKEVLEQIFDPFYTTKVVGKGTGLGLSTVHGILSNMSAALLVESEPDKGTTFELFMPLEEAVDIWAVDIKEKKIDFVKGHGRILVVDDDEDVKEMMVMSLVRMGYTVDSCTSAFDAIDLLREHYNEYDLLVSDQIMPKMTGLELSKAVAEDFPTLPVVIVSGYSDEEIEEEIKAMPTIKAFLRKPVNNRRLSEIVFDLVMAAKSDEGTVKDKQTNVIDLLSTRKK